MSTDAWEYELDCKPILDDFGITPKIPPRSAAEAASLFDVILQARMAMDLNTYWSTLLQVPDD